MYEAGVARPGTMAALLGDPSEPIEQLCARASSAPDGGLVVPANFNCPGQLVISGEVAGVRLAMEMAKAAGVRRAVELNVSGAFHSPLMQPAVPGLEAALRGLSFAPATVPVCANVSGELVADASRASALLVEQLTSPVRWTEVVGRLAAVYPDALFVEMGPGSVLAGLVRKIAPGVQTMSVGTAADIDQLLARLN